MNILEIKNLSKNYVSLYEKRAILKNVNLQVRKGALLTIIGPSGCGKTTLLHIVAGLLGASKGEILVKVDSSRPKIGLVFQDSRLFPWLTLEKNIAFGLELKKDLQSHEKVNQMIKLVGLRGSEDLYPYQLSGGMQRRAAIARALVLDPEILLLDEPFTNLDSKNQQMIKKIILNLNLKKKKTIIIVTHGRDSVKGLPAKIISFRPRSG